MNKNLIVARSLTCLATSGPQRKGSGEGGVSDVYLIEYEQSQAVDCSCSHQKLQSVDQ